MGTLWLQRSGPAALPGCLPCAAPQGWAVDGLRPGAAPAILASPARLLPAAPSKAASAAGTAPGEGSLTAVALHCGDWPAAVVALGLSTGAVHLLRADVTKSKVTAPVPAAQLRDAGGSGASGSGASGGGITALHFASPAGAAGAAGEAGPSGGGGGRRGEAPAAPELHLFAVGAARLAAFDARTGRRLLDDECGAPPGCSAVSARGELMVAGQEAVYCYTGGRGCCPVLFSALWLLAMVLIMQAGGGALLRTRV